MPVLALSSGRMCPNRPESCVDVVDATTMDLSWASAGVQLMRAPTTNPSSRRETAIFFPPFAILSSP